MGLARHIPGTNDDDTNGHAPHLVVDEMAEQTDYEDEFDVIVESANDSCRSSASLASLQSAIEEFSQNTQLLPSHDISVRAWDDVYKKLAEEDSEPAYDIASMLAERLNRMKFASRDKDEQSANMSLLLGAAVIVDEHASAHKYKKLIGLALATTAFVLIGATISVGLVGGVAGVPAAIAALTYYAAKGSLSKTAVTLLAKLIAPSLVLGVGGYHWTKYSLFPKRPMYQSFEQAQEKTKDLINTPFKQFPNDLEEVRTRIGNTTPSRRSTRR